MLKTVAALQNALPKLIVSFVDSEEPKNHKHFLLPLPPEPMEHEIFQKIKKLRLKYPPEQAPLSSAAQVSINLDPIPPKEYERYNRELAEYITSHEQHLKDTWTLLAAMKRSICFAIEIRNTGTSPAEDVDITLHFPDGFRLFSESDLPRANRAPQPPEKPREQDATYDRY